MTTLEGCDTFVVLPKATEEKWTIFGKNSDRPVGEVQEVVYAPPRKGDPGRPLKCTYISIPDVGETKAVILSKPGWMWGAEMGANDAGVVIGNEAVWTKINSPKDAEKRLLGMDLLRLGLERSNTAQEALTIITSLLEEHGQGGPCAEDDPDLLYHNSFLIVDASGEAWILETAERHWAAVKVDGTSANISNNLTITRVADKESSGARDAAKAAGLWDGSVDFVFGSVFAAGKPCDAPRQAAGCKLLGKHTGDGKFTAGRMMEILRNEQGGINMAQRTCGSMVSVLKEGGGSVHFLTGTPDPAFSVFKPFLFDGGNTNASPLTECHPKAEKHNRGHELWKLNQTAAKDKANKENIRAQLMTMESGGVEEVVGALKAGTAVPEAGSLFHECADAEAKILTANKG